MRYRGWLLAVLSAAGLPFAVPATAQASSGTCGGGLVPVQGEKTQRTFSDVRAIVVDGDVGSVRVTRSGGSEATVRTQACFTLSKPSLTQAARDGVLRIAWRCPRTPLVVVSVGRCSRDVEVTAPSGTSVTARTAAGDVTTTGIAGATQLTTSVGDARAERSGADRVSAATSTGDAVIDAAVAPSRASAVTSIGDVQVDVPAGGYGIDAATSIGRVSVAGVRTDPSSPRKIVARTQTGDVRIGTSRPEAAATPPAVVPARRTRTIAGVLRRGLRFRCTARRAGTCRATASSGRRRVAAGTRRARAGQTVTIAARLTAAGRRLLRRAQRSRRTVALTVRIAPPGARAVRSRMTLRP